MRGVHSVISSIVLALALCTSASAQDAAPQSAVLITNARIFDGKGESLSAPMSALVEGNLIKAIGANITAPRGATVIDAGGRTMTPGFIGVHERLMLQVSYGEALTSDDRYYAYVATQAANIYLSRGFTAVRDPGCIACNVNTLSTGVPEPATLWTSTVYCRTVICSS